MMPTDCSVLRTITILPNIRISWNYHPTFMLLCLLLYYTQDIAPFSIEELYFLLF